VPLRPRWFYLNLPCGEFRPVDLVLRLPITFSLSGNKEYLSGGWPNEIGPKAARSIICIIK
jgi:hypothetical protein